MGNPLRVILSAGQIADIDCASALIENLPGQAVVADKGYDAEHFVARIEATGAEAVIPPRSNRLAPRDFDRHLYRARNLIERFAGWGWNPDPLRLETTAQKKRAPPRRGLSSGVADYRLRLPAATSPAKPRPNSASVPGSGTRDTGATSNATSPIAHHTQSSSKRM